jgi:hypothetical protein
MGQGDRDRHEEAETERQTGTAGRGDMEIETRRQRYGGPETKKQVIWGPRDMGTQSASSSSQTGQNQGGLA